MSSVPRYRPRYTVDDYACWEGSWELWDGIPIATSPSPFGRHGQLAGRLITELNRSIDDSGCQAAVLAEIDWIVSRDTVVRPDVSVVCGSAPPRHIEQPPALVAEVLSAATRDRDLGEKKDLYRDHGVRWYLIVDPEKNSLAAFSLTAGNYQPTPANELLLVDLCSDCHLALNVPRTLR